MSFRGGAILSAVFLIWFCGTSLLSNVLPIVYAEDVPAQTNRKIERVLGNDGIDRHMLSLRAGTPITVSVYFGNSRGLGLGSDGRLRLLTSDGDELLAPATERSEYSVFVGFWLTAFHYFGRIQRYEVPADGTYIIEINGPGNRPYWIGIGVPDTDTEPLSLAEGGTGKFLIPGNHKRFAIDVAESEVVGLSYTGERGLHRWNILEATGNVRSSGTTPSIIFARSPGEELELRLEDEQPGIFTSGNDIREALFSITPSSVIQPDMVVPGTLSVRGERDLYAFTGSSRRPVTIDADFGNDQGNGLGRDAHIRLLSSTGMVLAAPGNILTPTRIFVGFWLDAFLVSARIPSFRLPWDGTYFIEVLHMNDGIGWYSVTLTPDALPDLSISDVAADGDALRYRYSYAQSDQPFSVSLHRSSDAILDEGDIEIAQDDITVPLSSDMRSFEIPRPDLHRPFLIVTLDAGDLILEQNESNNSGFISHDILEWYSPILHIFSDDFVPKEVGAMVRESKLDPLIGDDIENPTEEDLAARNTDLSLEDTLDMKGVKAGLPPVIPPVERFGKYQTAIYGRVTTDVADADEITKLPLLTAGKEYTVLQYWFFYPYNNFIWRHSDGTDRPGNNHEGDWEMIQIIIDPDSLSPLYSTYSWHWAGTTYAWNDLILDNDHPHVFVGKGGHANWGRGGVNYFAIVGLKNVFPQGDITPELDSENRVCIKHKSKTDCINYDMVNLVNPEGTKSWNNFKGMWGERSQPQGNSGPRSPAFIAYGITSPIIRWINPLLWANKPVPFGVSALANSPVNLSVIDRDGNTVGMHPDGSIASEIPGTYSFVPSDDGPEYIEILTDQDLTFRITGTGDGTMDFIVSRFGPDDSRHLDLRYDDVPITSDFRAELAITEENTQYALFIDTNNDGIYDQKFLPGASSALPIITPSISPVSNIVEATNDQGGGRRGSSGRGGTSVAADSSLRRIANAPSALAITGNANTVRHTEQAIIVRHPEQASPVGASASYFDSVQHDPIFKSRHSLRETLSKSNGSKGEARMAKHDTSQNSFIDVPEDAPYADAVSALLERGIIYGYLNPDGTRSFRPHQPVTIAEFAKMLCLALGLGWDDALPRTLSAQNNHWAYGYVTLLELRSVRLLRDPQMNVDQPMTSVQVQSLLHDLQIPQSSSLLKHPVTRIDAAQLLFDILQ